MFVTRVRLRHRCLWPRVACRSRIYITSNACTSSFSFDSTSNLDSGESFLSTVALAFSLTKNIQRYFFLFSFARVFSRLTMSYKCLNFNSPRPENFVIPSVPAYIRASERARRYARRTYTQRRAFYVFVRFYVPPCAPVLHTRSLSPARISRLSFTRSPSSSVA